MLFKRLQRGTENLEPGPLPPEKRRIGPKEAAGLYDPGPAPPNALTSEEVENLSPEEMEQEQRDWDENIKELLAITPNLDAEERQQVLTLNPKDWDDSTKEKVGVAVNDASENARRLTPELYPNQGYALGTSNVNPGLFFFRKQLKKPKL